VHYGPFASFGGRTPRQMHPATCGQCGQMTEVPFAPRGDRPVLCSECFALSRQSSPARAQNQP
jgi:CxxC-x17-CxxC domain-containing protein